MPPGSKKKGAPAATAPSAALWEWIDDAGHWQSYSDADSMILEREYEAKGPAAKFATKDLSFCKGKYVYRFDLNGMVQRNEKTKFARAIRRTGTDPPGKKAKIAKPESEEPEGEWWAKNDGGTDWMRMTDADAAILDKAWRKGPKAEGVKLSGFTFGGRAKPEWVYEINFKKMTQTNPVRKTTREIARGDEPGKKPDGSKKPFASAPKEKWQWWNGGGWSDYNEEDALSLEIAYTGGASYFMCTNPEFSAKRGATVAKPYIFDFTSMTQINSDAGTSRSMRRGTSGGKGKVITSPCGGAGSSSEAPTSISSTHGDDDLMHMSAIGKIAGDKSKTGAHGEAHGKAPIPPDTIPEAIVTVQRKLGAQSLRPTPSAKPDYGPVINSDEHARRCFDTMLERERKLAGKLAPPLPSSASALL